MTTFTNSNEHAFRRFVRDAIRRSDLTRANRDVTLALTNLWFHHRNGPKGYIHPGRKLLAKRAGVSEKTVTRTLKMLRAARVLRCVSNLHGGQGTATRYQLDISALMVLCGVDWLDSFLCGRDGIIARVPLSDDELSRKSKGKMSHCKTNVGTVPSQTEKNLSVHSGVVGNYDGGN